MRLVDNVRAVVRYSWSFRLNFLLAVLSAVDAGLTYYADGRVGMSMLVAGWTAFSCVARCVAQDKVSGPAATAEAQP